MKPYSQAAENNKNYILEQLKVYLPDPVTVLEIGSGTGQHAVYFSAQLPHLQWQTSDLECNHSGIAQWIEESRANNVAHPINLNVQDGHWHEFKAEAVYSANTAHIMSWDRVQDMIKGISAMLPRGGHWFQYGPFNVAGQYTSQSNADFDAWLKEDDARRGIRDIEAMTEFAYQYRIKLLADMSMPANNRLLIFKRF
nr:DUF938 domain-containing protein [Echinimonas agarilytica]